MKLNIKIISVLVLSSTIAFAGVQAHDHHNDDNRLERLAKHLELSQDQQASIADIIANVKEQHQRPDRETMKAKAQEMKEKLASLMASPTFDELTVKAQLEQRVAKHTNKALNKIKLLHAIYQELTLEQQPMFLKGIEMKMRMKMKKMMGHSQF